jgi:hypothetical protein
LEDDLRVVALPAALHEAEAEAEVAPEDVDQLVHHDEADSAAHHSDAKVAKPEILAPRPSAWGSHTGSGATIHYLKA